MQHCLSIILGSKHLNSWWTWLSSALCRGRAASVPHACLGGGGPRVPVSARTPIHVGGRNSFLPQTETCLTGNHMKPLGLWRQGPRYFLLMCRVTSKFTSQKWLLAGVLRSALCGVNRAHSKTLGLSLSAARQKEDTSPFTGFCKTGGVHGRDSSLTLSVCARLPLLPLNRGGTTF